MAASGATNRMNVNITLYAVTTMSFGEINRLDSKLEHYVAQKRNGTIISFKAIDHAKKKEMKVAIRFEARDVQSLVDLLKSDGLFESIREHSMQCMDRASIMKRYKWPSRYQFSDFSSVIFKEIGEIKLVNYDRHQHEALAEVLRAQDMYTCEGECPLLTFGSHHIASAPDHSKDDLDGAMVCLKQKINGMHDGVRSELNETIKRKGREFAEPGIFVYQSLRSKSRRFAIASIICDGGDCERFEQIHAWLKEDGAAEIKKALYAQILADFGFLKHLPGASYIGIYSTSIRRRDNNGLVFIVHFTFVMATTKRNPLFLSRLCNLRNSLEAFISDFPGNETMPSTSSSETEARTFVEVLRKGRMLLFTCFGKQRSKLEVFETFAGARFSYCRLSRVPGGTAAQKDNAMEISYSKKEAVAEGLPQLDARNGAYSSREPFFCTFSIRPAG
jgi:hypothetical protein